MSINGGPYAYTGGLLAAYPDKTPGAALQRISMRALVFEGEARGAPRRLCQEAAAK